VRAELIAWLTTAVAGLVMITQAWGWHGTRIVAVAQSLTPYLSIAVVGIAALAVWRRWVELATTAIAVGVGAMALSIPLIAGGGQPGADPGAVGLRIASVNLLYDNDRVADVADVLLDADADVIVFIEYTAGHQEVLTAHQLAGRYGHRVERTAPGPEGIAIWSRRPVAETDPPPTHLDSLDLTVDHADGSVRIVGIHVPTPVNDFDAWRRDLALVEQIGREAVGPTVVVGDLNATYWHPDFRDLLDAGFTDAHIAAGHGYATSWPTNRVVPPFVQLDHALTTDGLVSTEIADVPVPGSDHRGFVVTVAPARRAEP
jgi:endonuclease/exonuclease/phosphatase (EEP) superfamily protein YafD